MAPLLGLEVEALLVDASKRIEGEIVWRVDPDHPLWAEFTTDVISDAAYPISARGSYCAPAGKLSFVLIHKQAGRIYGLCMGMEHRNPDTRELIGELHKHRWTDVYRDKHAYVPADITATTTEVVLAWSQFCAEAKITHAGTMRDPPWFQEGFFD